MVAIWQKGRGLVPADSLVILLAGCVGVLAGVGAVVFNAIIVAVRSNSIQFANGYSTGAIWWIAVIFCPPLGLLCVAALTRRFAPEAQGLGVPEVISSVARHDGVIRPQVAAVKILASGLTIGTGGSVGREGPIVQIGSTLGSVAGQVFSLSARSIKVLVAAGAAAGISATFNAPLAGVVFSGEIILGSFAVESLTPIVIASVLADVVQQHIGEHKFEPAFRQLEAYDFEGAWAHLPTYLVLGLLAGLAAVLFIKTIYYLIGQMERLLPTWWVRAIVLGTVVGMTGAVFSSRPAVESPEASIASANGTVLPLPLLGVGYEVVDHALHLQMSPGEDADPLPQFVVAEGAGGEADSLPANKTVRIERDRLWNEFWWFLPLVLLKPIMTGCTLAGGGSGGVFAPSLYIGATLGAAYGLLVQGLIPTLSYEPGAYAIVGMGAVVAGTTHGILSAILVVYEMTGSYEVILPLMAAAGVSSLVARLIDPESIYYKKLSRRGEYIARGHDMHRLDHIMVRDVMIRTFPMLQHNDDMREIIRVARKHPELESLPVMGSDGMLQGIIRAEDLHRVLDSDISRTLIYAGDIALRSPVSVSPQENLIEALRDFGTRDIDMLPVEVGQSEKRRLVGLLLRTDVMRRYRQEMLVDH